MNNKKLVYKAVTLLFSRVVIRNLEVSSLKLFRKIEKKRGSIISFEADIVYLDFCLKNQLLPSFADFKTYDGNLRYERSTTDFKFKLVKDLVDEKRLDLQAKRIDLVECVKQLELKVSHVKFTSIMIFLNRIMHQRRCDIALRHKKKLTNLYGGKVKTKESTSNILNLSSYKLNRSETELLSKGLSFAVKTKEDPIKTKVEIEHLFKDIKKEENNKNIIIKNEDDLKGKLKYQALRKDSKFGPSPLSKEELACLKGLKENQNIIIKKPDKGGGVVILDTNDYNTKLKSLISDASKFVKCDGTQSETVKKRLNDIADGLKDSNPILYRKLKRIGEFNDGFLYGSPKVHKNKVNPPLRPIISMSGTVTHDVAQMLDSVIRPFLDSSNLLRSTEELILKLENLKVPPGHIMVSLDVESLFTNVPVMETIDFILEQVYHHCSLPPPEIDVYTMKELLILCTTQTPFKFGGETFLQKEGVSMGSPLGCIFSDFYMVKIEKKVLEEGNLNKPMFYVRYVDDILAIFENIQLCNLFIEHLKVESCLNFTYEIPTDHMFHFLDVEIEIKNDGSITRGVYIKPTDKGIYSDYGSYLPTNYKISLIKTLIHRAFRICSTWELFDKEKERILQNLVNCNYPQLVVDRVISNTINKLVNKKEISDKANEITFYYRTYIPHFWNNDHQFLTKVFNDHLKTVNKDAKMNLRMYYKPKRLANCFSTRETVSDFEKHGLVYIFNCPEDSCNASYIGYTTNKLLIRMRQHRYKPSNIQAHYVNNHNKTPKSDFYNHFKILYMDSMEFNVKTAEALYIKTMKPSINKQFNDMALTLHIFN